MTQYPLDGVVRYFRKPSAGALLYAMYQHASKAEKESGGTLEFGLMYFSPGNDYVGVTFLSPALGEAELEQRMRDDDAD